MLTVATANRRFANYLHSIKPPLLEERGRGEVNNFDLSPHHDVRRFHDRPRSRLSSRNGRRTYPGPRKAAHHSILRSIRDDRIVDALGVLKSGRSQRMQCASSLLIAADLFHDLVDLSLALADILTRNAIAIGAWMLACAPGNHRLPTIAIVLAGGRKGSAF